MYLCVKKNTLDAVKTLFTSKPVTVLKNLWSWCVQLNFPTQHVHLTKPIISQLEVWFLRTIEHWTFQGAAITETIVLNNFGLMVCEHHPSQLPLSYFGWNLTVHRVMLGILLGVLTCFRNSGISSYICDLCLCFMSPSAKQPPIWSSIWCWGEKGQGTF